MELVFHKIICKFNDWLLACPLKGPMKKNLWFLKLPHIVIFLSYPAPLVAPSCYLCWYVINDERRVDCDYDKQNKSVAICDYDKQNTSVAICDYDKQNKSVAICDYDKQNKSVAICDYDKQNKSLAINDQNIPQRLT